MIIGNLQVTDPINASSATTAANISGGIQGSVPYQSSTNTTTFLIKGDAGEVMMMNEWETAPEWGIPVTQALVLTQEELLSIGNPTEGLTVYCTDCGSMGAQCIFANNIWNYIEVSSQSLETPQPEEITYLENGLKWRWKNVQGADSYRWNSSSDYSSAITPSLNLEYDQEGTECNRSYMCYVWAVNNTGSVSAPLELYEWVEAPCAPEAGNNELVDETNILWKWRRVNTALGYRFGSSSDYSQSEDVGTSTVKPEAGLAPGMHIRYVWAYNSCGHSDSLVLTFTKNLPAPLADDAVWVSDTLIWKWNAVQNASEYKWSTSNNYSTAISTGDSTQIGESGLTCGTFYTRYVWAENLWGHSDSLILYDAPGPPKSPVLIDGGYSSTKLSYEWDPVEGATGYKYNRTNSDYNSAYTYDLGDETSCVIRGLACGRGYNVYIWAYNNCGHSEPLIRFDHAGACDGNGSGIMRSFR